MIPGKWIFPSLLLVVLLAIVKASGATSLGVRKPEFSKNSIGSIRHPRGSGGSSGNDPTTMIPTLSTKSEPSATTTTTVTPQQPPLFEIFDKCSNETDADDFVDCINDKISSVCQSDSNCEHSLGSEFSNVKVHTVTLFDCAASKKPCGSGVFSEVDKALNKSVEDHCQKLHCSFAVDELLRRMFPGCRMEREFTCEPTTTAIPTTRSISKNATNEEFYVPPHEDLPEDFSCQNLGEKYKACEYLCKQLASLKPPEEPEIDWRFLPGAFMTAGSLLAIPILFVLTKRMTNELEALNKETPTTTADDPNAKLKIAYAAALDVKDSKNLEKKKEKSQEVPSPPSLNNDPAAQKMRAKLLETHQNLQNLRAHAKKCVEEHKKDAASSKFPKKGAIYIPNKPEIPPPAPLPDNIILDNVEWCSDYNEMYVIGSDVDDIELEDDSTASSLDESTKIEKKSQLSKDSKTSKKSVGSKKNKKRSQKSRNSKKSKKSVKSKKDGH